MHKQITYFQYPAAFRKQIVLLGFFFSCCFYTGAKSVYASFGGSDSIKETSPFYAGDSVRIFFSDGLRFHPYSALPLWVYTDKDTFSVQCDSMGILLLPFSVQQIMLNTGGGKVKFWYREKATDSDSFLLVKNELGSELCRLPKSRNTIHELFVLSEIRQPVLLARREYSPKQELHPKPVSGTVYKVQILTSGKLLPEDDPRFKGEKVARYTDKGIYKYTVGEFSDIRAAALLQQSMRNKGFHGAFVVVFRDGVRIK